MHRVVDAQEDRGQAHHGQDQEQQGPAGLGARAVEATQVKKAHPSSHRGDQGWNNSSSNHAASFAKEGKVLGAAVFWFPFFFRHFTTRNNNKNISGLGVEPYSKGRVNFQFSSEFIVIYLFWALNN